MILFSTHLIFFLSSPGPLYLYRRISAIQFKADGWGGGGEDVQLRGTTTVTTQNKGHKFLPPFTFTAESTPLPSGLGWEWGREIGVPHLHCAILT